MKNYFVQTGNVSDLQCALGRLIEYAKFLEDESGRSGENFVEEILQECEIEVIEENA